VAIGANGAGPRTENRTFELIGGHPVLDLVNTLDWRFRDEGPEELMTDYGDLVRFAEQAGLFSHAVARRLIRNTRESKAAHVVAVAHELREAAAQVLYAGLDGEDPPASATRRLETYFLEARKAQRLQRAGVRLAWQFAQSTSLPELPLWLLSLGAAELMTSDEMDLLRACGDPECRWLFLDTSKNHTRRWCDMKICGNRMKARRFKAQHRT
jgi:predicted RNA-binding Zn ribbon-like protein